MSITYEEALSTLTSMFGAPWTQETLDAVLRHHQGHMENTVETVLAHGNGDPAALVERLKNPQASVSMDEEIARQLANESRPSAAPGAKKKKQLGRGTPTQLPTDFLRIPGRKYETSTVVDQDEALARMLQDELFTQELANNPEFAHLARAGGRRILGGMAQNRASGRPSPSAFPGAGRGAAGSQTQDGPNIVEKLSEMGENAKKRLALLAAQWNANMNRNARPSPASGGHGGSSGSSAERRGLLDGEGDDEEEVAFLGRRSNAVEMQSVGESDKKQN